MSPAPDPEVPPASGTDSGDASFLRNLRLWAGDFSGFLQARLELAGLEGREALSHYIKVAIFVALALFGVIFGYVFLMVGVVMLICYFTGWSLVWPVLIVAALHFLGAYIFLRQTRNRLLVPQFQQTLGEFRKDRDWKA